MGTLTPYLQQKFSQYCPAGWQCQHEVRLLSPMMAKVLGYAPRVDVLLAREDGSQRLWIEFEVSRADPVANHAKFATAHLFEAQAKEDIFISMISPHVIRGRHNLAANTILLMRQIGMQAFQTTLFPYMSPADVKTFNHLDHDTLLKTGPDVKAEVERVLTISKAVFTIKDYAMHFVGNLMEVMLNLHRWHEDLATPEGQVQWGRRLITYFVYDPRSKRFAPSKFCAYSKLPTSPENKNKENLSKEPAEMTIDFYTSIDRTHPLFDGGRAWKHLVKHLGMVRQEASEVSKEILAEFEAWLEQYEDYVMVHGQGPVFLMERG